MIIKKICKNRYLLSIGIAPLYLGSSLEENNNQIKNENILLLIIFLKIIKKQKWQVLKNIYNIFCNY